jgi:hypothetical protein
MRRGNTKIKIRPGKVAWQIKMTDNTQRVLVHDEIKFSGQKLVYRDDEKWSEYCHVSKLRGSPKLL